MRPSAYCDKALSEGDVCGSPAEGFCHYTATLSYHIRILTDCGLVQARREGNWIFYSINPHRGAMVRCFLEDAGLEQ